MDSILNTIKKLLGIDADDDSFDVDITIGINAAIFNLSQMGVGPNNAIHYGIRSPNIIVERHRGDTCPWKY